MMDSATDPASQTKATLPTAGWTPVPNDSLDLVRRHGNFTIAWSTAVQPGLRHFGDREGYLAWASKWKYRFALGDPVAPINRHEALIDAFVEQAGRRKPCFVNIMAGTASILQRRGYYINPMGVDTWLGLATWDVRGKAKEPFRYAANWLRRHGYSVRELSFAEMPASRVQRLSDHWRQTRTIKNREVGLLNRPLVLEDEPEVRKFFLLDADSNLQAFVYLDPVFENGQVIGYATAIKRRHPLAPGCAEMGIMKHCIDVLRDEGVSTLRLGLSPLAALDDRTFRANPLLKFSLRYGYRARWVNRWFYNVQGHAEFKRRFRGTEHPVYFATPVMFNDLRIIAMLRLMNVL